MDPEVTNMKTILMTALLALTASSAFALNDGRNIDRVPSRQRELRELATTSTNAAGDAAPATQTSTQCAPTN